VPTTYQSGYQMPSPKAAGHKRDRFIRSDPPKNPSCHLLKSPTQAAIAVPRPATNVRIARAHCQFLAAN
jgi:hypothetical protein